MSEEEVPLNRGIAKFGADAESESVQLRARRAILHEQIAVSKFSNFEYRMAELEEEVRVRNGNAAPPGWGRARPASGRDHRSLDLGLVRRIVPLRPGTGRVPPASPGPSQSAAAGGGLARLGIR
jgi:hypothetical protein